MSLVHDMPGQPWTTKGFAGTHCLCVKGFIFCAGLWKSTKGGGQGEVSVHMWRLLGCQVGAGSFVRLGAGSVVKVIVVVIEWGDGTRARLSTALMTRVISTRSTSDFSVKFWRVCDCCVATLRRLSDC